MSRIVVLGHDGQLASEIRDLVGNDPAFQFIPKTKIPIDNLANLKFLLTDEKPTTVINCTAYTAVDKAEQEQDLCFALNRDLPAALATLSSELNFHLVHFSTDYVFSGKSRSPILENDKKQPLNTYGRSKSEGEDQILKLAKSASIIRTSWLYSKFGNNFVRTIRRLGSLDQPLKIVDDQTGAPTWAYDLAKFTVENLVDRNASPEIYHFSNEAEITWADFAEEILKSSNLKKEVLRIPTSDFPTAATRPAYSVLSKDKVRARFGIKIHSWKDSLHKSLQDWK